MLKSILRNQKTTSKQPPSPDLASLMTPLDGAEPDSGVKGGLAAAGRARRRLEEQQAGQFLLLQLLDGAGGQLAEVALSAVLLVHGSDGVEDELLAQLLLQGQRPLGGLPGGALAAAGGARSKETQQTAGFHGQQNT